MFRIIAICLLMAFTHFSCDETEFQLLDSEGKPVNLDYVPSTRDSSKETSEDEFEF